MFNYLTRVADASGIEFDYPAPLPAFQPERGQGTGAPAGLARLAGRRRELRTFASPR